jgi:hypothetical protein
MKKSFLLSLIDAVVCDVVDPHTTSQGDFQRIFSAPMLDDYNAGVLFLFFVASLHHRKVICTYPCIQ